MVASTILFPTPLLCNHGSGIETDLGTIEAKLVSQLVLFLGKCPRSLKEISSIAPHNAHHLVQEVGGVLTWLKKYSELFSISGKPGEEVVSLKVTREPNATSEPITAQWKGDTSHDFARAHTTRDDSPESEIESALLLRGLPYKATENDIRKFLGPFTKKLKGNTPIQMIPNKGKRPSGFAKVQLDAPESARDACQYLHKHSMNDRYVEVFPFGEKKYKAITKMATVAYHGVAADAVSSQEDLQARSALVQECRDYMESSGRTQLLLSALGAALSDGSRLYLKRTNQGLKQLLHEHPEEFEFGGKSQQQTVRRVSLLKPSAIQHWDCKPGNAHTRANAHFTRSNNGRSGVIELHLNSKLSSLEARRGLFGTPSSTNFDDVPPPQTPELQPPRIPHVLQTPSDWGTPCPGDCESWRLAQQNFNGVPRPVLPESQRSSSVFQDNLSHNLQGVQNVAQGLQSPWARTRNSQSILEEECPSSNSSSAVCIHGLPYDTTEQDVLAFFSAHNVAQHVEDVPHPVVFLKKTADVPGKSAVVSLESSAVVHIVLQALQGRQLDLHTISVTAVLSDRQNPMRVSGMVDTNLAPTLATQSKRTSSSVDSAGSFKDLFDFLVLERCIDNVGPYAN